MQNRRIGGVASVALVLSGCPGGTSDGGAQPPTSEPSVAPRCELWKGVTSLVARNQAGHGAYFRELRYDFAKGVVDVHDSDLYATGKESETPRVIQQSKTLSADEKTRVEEALFRVWPDAEAMKRQCAPGGCARLEVSHRGGATTVEDSDTVAAVMKELVPFFPELRTN